MKFAKPTYDAKTRVYTCDITDGFRLCVRRESGSFLKELSDGIDTTERISHLIKTTQGWFSKPLTEEFLKGKIQYDIPTKDIPECFEGSVEWQAKTLIISKDTFLFMCDVVSMIEDEKVSLDFPEEETQVNTEDVIPFEEKNEVIAIGPTRRQLHKQKVMLARTKAARALFHAERLTQEYYNSYGDATDWEDEEADE